MSYEYSPDPGPDQADPYTVVLCVLVAIATGVIGYLVGSSRERNAATAVVLTGTVTWSNEETRLIAFEVDGVARGPARPISPVPGIAAR
jgi:hypothetical protein